MASLQTGSLKARLALERQCRKHYIHNPAVARFLIRTGRVLQDFEKMADFYGDRDVQVR